MIRLSFDLSNDHFLRDRVDFNHEEFADELTHIMSLPELECFKFKIEPDPGDLTSIDLGIRKNVSTTNVNAPLEDDQSSLFTYVVWIFLAFLTYPVVPPYLLSTGNEDTIFDPVALHYHSSMSGCPGFLQDWETDNEERTKNQAKTTKRELRMEKTVKDKAIRSRKSNQVKKSTEKSTGQKSKFNPSQTRSQKSTNQEI
ncbi:hypothetical protein Tco_0564035 [Tanacetum coccineum]